VQQYEELVIVIMASLILLVCLAVVAAVLLIGFCEGAAWMIARRLHSELRAGDAAVPARPSLKVLPMNSSTVHRISHQRAG
jgi:hypothetical protein